MALSTSTDSLAVGASRTFGLSPGSALTIVAPPNVRATITETPNTVSASGVGGNSSRTHNLQLGQTVTYGPYPMGGTVVVANASDSGTAITWVRSDALVAESASGAVSLVDADGNTYPLDSQLDGTARPALLGSSRVYELTYSAGGAIERVADAIPPWLWADSQGVAQWAHNPVIKGVGFRVGTKIHIVGTLDRNAYVYDTATGGWSKTTASVIDATASMVHHLFFADSRGYLFTAWAPSSVPAGGRKLYRSTDGGVTWTAVLTTTDMTYTQDYIGSMVESDNGYLFATSYNGNQDPCTKAIWRSTDGGATWTNIIANVDLAQNYARHIHIVHWDRFRKALWLSGGDGGAMKICVSTDYGTTWTAWDASFQATAIVATPTAVMFCSDIAGYHDIYRAEGASVADILAATLRLQWKHGAARTPVSPIAGMTGVEFAWFGRYTDDGIVVMPYARGGSYGCALMVSADDGCTWTDALGGTASTESRYVAAIGSGTAGEYGFAPIVPSDYVSGWDGWLYILPVGLASFSSLRYRIYPGKTTLHVNSATGDDVSGDGVETPFASVPEFGVTAAARLVLDANYTKPATLTRKGLILDRNGYTLGQSDGGGSYIIDENFEGTSTLTTTVTGSATADQTSTTNPHADPFSAGAGTRCARLVTANAGEVAMVLKSNAFQSTVVGDEAWMQWWVYVTAASITTSPVIAQVQGGVNISIDLTSNGGGLTVTTAGDSRIYKQPTLAYTAFPLGAYVRLKVAVKKHATAGRVRVWQTSLEGPAAVSVLLFDIQGVDTVGSGWTNGRIGLNGGNAVTMDVDEVKMSLNFDPELPGAFALQGSGQLVIPDMRVS